MANGLFAKPERTANQVQIQFEATSSTSVTFFDGTDGSDIPSLAGYVMANAGGSTARVNFLNDTVVVKTIDVTPGKYQSFFVLGADNITISATTATTTSGDLNVVINNNPL
ncbi:S-Ena type endospore appendage [Alkalihalobacillus sp. BA299]|uniref:S-Ena type endospore appendage n=1 Tax=Alkalihalobacillus sp. BA299 TaxID=2815938 RepID=UPI001ADB5BEB|nr:S-Ena type endospore appendage [Alkalihalobacillus sp. BA299]